MRLLTSTFSASSIVKIFAPEDENEICQMGISDRWNLRHHRHRADVFFRESNQPRLSTGDHTPGIFLWIHRRDAGMAGFVFDLVERPDKVSIVNVAGAAVDLVLGVLFVVAFMRTSNVGK